MYVCERFFFLCVRSFFFLIGSRVFRLLAGDGMVGEILNYGDNVTQMRDADGVVKSACVGA